MSNNGIDVFNVILICGVILLVILITVMLILYLRREKKKEKEPVVEETDTYTEQIPVKEPDTIIEPVQAQEETTEELLSPIEEPMPEPEVTLPIEPEPVIEEENNFVAEEHVLEYDNNLFNLPSLKKNNSDEPEEVKQPEEPFTMPTKPYERNVLRQMSLSQTSPIGLTIPKDNPPVEEKLPEPEEETRYIIKEEDDEIPIEGTPELQLEDFHPESLFNEEPTYEEPELPEEIPEPIQEEVQEPVNNNELEFSLPDLEKIEEPIEKEEPVKVAEPVQEKEDNKTYLEEVSRKLSEAEVPDEIERTEYEKQQEEDAIISYKELMEKKDSIQTVDEEDAVISIDELIQRKKEEEKIYNITEEEATDDFISELKKFREDL